MEKPEHKIVAHCISCGRHKLVKTYEDNDTGRIIYCCDMCFEGKPTCTKTE